MNTEGFKNRQAELLKLRQLVDEGRAVVWVTGPAQSGKSWLASRFVRERGWETNTARFELRGGPDVQAVLDGVNRFLLERAEDRFYAWCRTADVSVADKAAALCQVLKGGGYVIVLDSFEDVADDAGWTELVSIMQEGLEGSWVFVGSRVRAEWADRHAEVEVGPMEREAAEELLTDAGAPSEGRDELFAAVGGLPGALELAGALAQDRGAKAVAEDVKGAAGEVGERLLAETFEAAGEGAQKLWTGLCLLPSPVTRTTAEALCQRDDFGDAWQELVRRKLLDPGEERAELHPLARAVGERRLEGMADWRQACGQRIARFYADFAEEKADDRDATDAELENILAAARLAFHYQEWEALWAMGALGERLHLLGHWTACETLLRLCVDGADKAGSKKARAAFTQNLGIALQDRGKLEEAEALYRQSLEIERETENRRGVAQSLHQLGMLAQERGKLEEAEDFYKQSLEIKRGVGDRAGEAATLHQLGVLAQERGSLEEAEDFYKQSLEIERGVGNRPGEAVSLHQLGIAAQDRGKLEEAEGLYRQSLEIERETENRRGVAQSLHQLGMLAQERGKLEEAESLYGQAHAAFVDIGDRTSEAAVLHQLGTVAQRRGKLEEAEDWYNQSLEIAREVGNRPGEAKTLAQMALLAEAQGDLRLAVERMEQAVAMMEEMGMGEAGKARGDLERLRKLREK